jgi:hypothetical protein
MSENVGIIKKVLFYFIFTSSLFYSFSLNYYDLIKYFYIQTVTTAGIYPIGALGGSRWMLIKIIKLVRPFNPWSAEVACICTGMFE